MTEKTLGIVVDFEVQNEIENFCSKKGLLVEGSFLKKKIFLCETYSEDNRSSYKI
jgi:hypothetical protein